MEARLKISQVVAQHGFVGDIPLPDISTKEKAQKYIGLNPDELHRKKEEFKKVTVPQWIQSAKEKGTLYTAKAN